MRTVKFSQVKRFKDNPRKINPKNLERLRSLMDRFGYVELIVWNERSGNIVDGHQRYGLMLESGETEADMVVVDLSEEDELAANITLDNPAIEGEFDSSTAELIDSVEVADPDIFASGGFGELRDAVSRIGKSETDKTDTECPCCGHRWLIDDKDVVVMTSAEQEKLSWAARQVGG